MNKFETMLNQSSSAIRGQRAILVAKYAKKAQEALVRDLDDKLDVVQEQLLATTDIYPQSELTLMVTNDKFNPQEWVKRLQSLKIQKANLEIELSLAQETYEEFFGVEVVKTPKIQRGGKKDNTETDK
jgi:hypothetical protein